MRKQPMKHELKTDPNCFDLSFKKLKHFEIRWADRDFQVGDLLVLKETYYSAQQMKKENFPLAFTGRTLEVEVVAMISGEHYGIQPGYVILITKE